MAEIDEKELKEIKRGITEEQKNLKKTVHIIKDKRQSSIRIPRNIERLLKIDHTKDLFEFELISEKKGFKLKGRLVQDEI